ncbi:MAG: hypothetical protein HFJ50_04750 [Clostridia bacterium]|jgi:hypothetical protein|nr:hypothetical protein [Clostridia bacterium]
MEQNKKSTNLQVRENGVNHDHSPTDTSGEFALYLGIWLTLGFMTLFAFGLMASLQTNDKETKEPTEVPLTSEVKTDTSSTDTSGMHDSTSTQNELNNLRSENSSMRSKLEALSEALKTAKDENASLYEKVRTLEEEKTQIAEKYENAEKLLAEINSIPKSYKDVYFSLDEIVFAKDSSTAYALGVDKENGRLFNLFTNEEFALKGISSHTEYFGFGEPYEFALEDFLNKDIRLSIKGYLYSNIGIPDDLQMKAVDGKLNLYDICVSLFSLRSKLSGELLY